MASEPPTKRLRTQVNKFIRLFFRLTFLYISLHFILLQIEIESHPISSDFFQKFVLYSTFVIVHTNTMENFNKKFVDIRRSRLVTKTKVKHKYSNFFFKCCQMLFLLQQQHFLLAFQHNENDFVSDNENSCNSSTGRIVVWCINTTNKTGLNSSNTGGVEH